MFQRASINAFGHDLRDKFPIKKANANAIIYIAAFPNAKRAKIDFVGKEIMGHELIRQVQPSCVRGHLFLLSP